MSTATLPFVIPDIPGWTSEEELSFLYDEAVRLDGLVPGGLLEIGCWLGRSALVLAQADFTDVIDTFEGSPEIYPEEIPDRPIYDVFAENVGRVCGQLGLPSPRLHAYIGLSNYWLSMLPGPYRLIFVDGGHDFSTAYPDILNSVRLLSPGGTLVVDDICDGFPGVERAVAEVLNNEVEGVGKMGVWRKP